MSVPSLMSAARYDASNISVYRMRSARIFGAYAIIALGAFVIGLFIWFPLSAERDMVAEYPWTVLAGFLLFDICVYISLASLRTRLIISPWGIEYYDMGIKLRVPWKSVVGFEKLRYVYRSVDSLVTSQQADMSRLILASLIISKQQYLPASDMDIDKIRHSIPIEQFADDWRNSSLCEEIKRYAPRVFGNEAEGESSSRTKTAGIRDMDAAGNQAEVDTNQSTSDVALPASHLDETRTGAWRKAITLVVVVVEVMFAFFVAPSIYRSAQPLWGAAKPLPGQLFFKGTYGPSDLSRNGQFLAAGSQVLTFPEGTSKIKVTLPPRKDGTSQPIESIALSDDGKLVAAGDEYGNAFIWQVADGHLIQTLSVTQPDTKGDVYSVAFSPDDRMLVAVGPTGEIKVWNVDDGTLLRTMKSSRTARFGAKLLFGPSGQLLVSLIDGTVEIWRAQDGSLMGKANPGDWVEDMAMLGDGRTLALGTLYGGIYLWDVRTGAITKTIKERKNGRTEAIYGIAISPDGKTIASGSSLGGIQLWSVDGDNPKNMRDSSGTTVRWMTFSPDGSKLIYTKYNDGSIWVWRRDTQAREVSEK